MAEQNNRIKKGNVYVEREGARKVTVTGYTDKSMSRVTFTDFNGKNGSMNIEPFKKMFRCVKRVPVRHYPKQPTRAERAKKLARTKKPKRGALARAR